MYLRIPLSFFVVGGAGGGDSGVIHDRALAQRHATSADVGYAALKDLLAQPVFLQQVTEGQDRDPI